MRIVTVNIEELLGILRKNRKTHEETFEKACVAFQKKMVEVLELSLKLAREGKPERVQVRLPVPEKHITSYDTAISMLEMSLRAGEVTIQITDMEFENYVNDHWEWDRSFFSNTTSYTRKE
jgi:hypothetical protein